MKPAFKSYVEWYTARSSALSHRGLWLDGREPGRPDPAGFEPARLRVLICRLSPYDDVLASITHRLLLHVARSVPGVYADLAFFPSAADAALMRKDGVPLWLATGAKRAPAEFDVVAISLSVQQEALNLPAALQESGLRLDFAGRMADAGHPWIILGGHGAGSVPFAHGDAAGPGTGGLVDAVCLGDGLTWLREFLGRVNAAKATGLSKPEVLESLARDLPGTYVPAFYRHVVKDGRLAAIEPRHPGLPQPVPFRQDPLEVWLKDYDGAYVPFSEEELEETLPLAAGCAYRCRFCQTGWMRSELSAAPREALVGAATRFKAAMVNSDLNLLASDACSLPGLESLLDALCPLFRHVSIKSLSVSSLVRRPESFHLLRQLAKHEFTFGVEGISARFRAYLGKPATAGDLLRIAGTLAAGGLRQMKLFFILTGLEEERDLAELERLLKSLRAKVPGCRIIASFMPLFHAPFTPLQFAPIRELSAELERTLASAVRQAGAEFRWSARPDEIALMNRLCRAGRSATPALVQFSLHRDLRYDRRLAPNQVQELARTVPANAGEQNLDSVFPWSDLRASVDAPALWRSYQAACRELQAGAAPADADGTAPPRPIRSPDGVARPDEAERLFFWIWIPPEQARYPDHVVARSSFRGMFAGWKAGVAAYLGAPLLARGPDCSGLAVVSAEFKRGIRIPKTCAPLDETESAAILGDSLLFGVHWPATEPAQILLKAFKEGRVKFQTVRHGTSRWHVVERAYRARTGVTALREDEAQTWLFSQQRPPLLENAAALPAGPAGVNQMLLAKTRSACRACKGAVFQTLKSVAVESPPVCFDCLTKSGCG